MTLLTKLNIWILERRINKYLEKIKNLRQDFTLFFDEERIHRYQHCERIIEATEAKLKSARLALDKLNKGEE